MGRPNFPPDWSTDPNYPIAGKDWDGTPTRADPGAGMRAAGFVPEDPRAAEHENFLFGNHGDWIKYIDSLSGDSIGRALFVRDDFLGDTLNRTIWSPFSSNCLLSLIDDSVNGGSGTLVVDARTAGLTWNGVLATKPVALGGKNWRQAIRCRFPNKAGWNVGASATHGLVTSSGANADAYFAVSQTSPNIRFVINGAVWDTGVAVTPGIYQLLEMIQINGTVNVYVDGVLTNTLAYVSGLAAMTISGQGFTTADGASYVDDATLYVERYSTTGAFISPVPPHVEKFYNVAITSPGVGNLHEWLDLVFGANFPDTLYGAADVTINVTDGGPNVGWTLRNKGLGSARIRFDAPFNGTVSLKIKEPV